MKTAVLYEHLLIALGTNLFRFLIKVIGTQWHSDALGSETGSKSSWDEATCSLLEWSAGAGSGTAKNDKKVAEHNWCKCY